MTIETAVQKLRDAAGEAGRTFLWFGTFGAYFLTTVAATTHENLLRGTAVKLPLLAVDLPIVGFYLVAPVLFLLLHLYLMFQLVLLGSRTAELVQASDLRIAREVAPSFPVAQYLLGGLGWFRPVFGIAIFVAVIMLPSLGLLFVQIRFLPYHDPTITALHQALVAVDAVGVSFLWYLVLTRLRPTRPAWPRRPAGRLTQVMRPMLTGVGYAALGLFGLSVLLFSLRVATIPSELPIEVQLPTNAVGEPISPCAAEAALPELPTPATIAGSSEPGVDGICTSIAQIGQFARTVLPRPRYPEAPKRRMSCLTYLLFEAPTTPLDMRRNLVIRGTSFAADGSRVGGGFDLRGRDLRFADFSASNLSHADLRGANLYGADLRDTVLTRADLGDVPQTEFDRCGGFTSRAGNKVPFCRTVARSANFENARLDAARLTKIDLRGARLSGAVLTRADVVEADLSDASLGSADVSAAELTGVHLDRANMRELRATAADLTCAWSEGADLTAADLTVAVAGSARLAGAGLTEARLVGTYMPRADLRGARLAGAHLEGIDLRAANLLGVSWASVGLPPATLAQVDLRGARTGADLPPNLGGLSPDSGPAGELTPERYDEALIGLLSPFLPSPPEPSVYRTGVVQRIRWDWQDSCGPRLYRSRLASELLAGACERDQHFTPAEWWVLQIARRAAVDRDAADRPPGVRRPPRCVTGPPPSPGPCAPSTTPWVPVTDMPASSSG